MIAARELRLMAGSKMLLDDVTLYVPAGEFTAVLGPNGAGKTTLLRTLAGIRSAESGVVEIDGVNVRAMHAARRARAVAYVASDEIFLEQLTVRDVVSTGRYAHHRWWDWREEPRDRDAVDGALAAVGMQGFSERAFATLSSGERQRIWIALALAQESRFVLLDEPTSHLDVRIAQEILAVLRSQVHAGKGVVCVLHDINEAAEFADRIAVLGRGALLAQGNTQDVLSGAALEDAYGVSMERTRSSRGRLRVFPASNSSEPTPR
ncbi:MAG TPA: ABC transporter ATP-binding protein [Candidatus Baltobacteraceae bacterium]|jgi:iron complex transport system ATP-binding protein|nr:ABC transporter ATP-binding protein [Candidatus Baltobacteraceae bacterium]